MAGDRARKWAIRASMPLTILAMIPAFVIADGLAPKSELWKLAIFVEADFAITSVCSRRA